MEDVLALAVSELNKTFPKLHFTVEPANNGKTLHIFCPDGQEESLCRGLSYLHMFGEYDKMLGATLPLPTLDFSAPPFPRG